MNDRVDESLLAPVVLWSPESESSLLGALLLDNGMWDRVGTLVAEADFFRQEHRLVFSAISRMLNAGQPADVFTVYDQLQRDRKDNAVGGLPYLNSLAQYVPSAASVRQYALIVRDMALRRRLMSASSEINELACQRTVGFEETLEQAAALLTGLCDLGTTDEWQSMDAGLVQLLDRINAQAEGTAVDDFTATGLLDLDARLDGGPRDGELIVIGARPGMGKSALALSMGVHMAMESGKAIGMFSMEMPKAQVVARAMSLQSRIHLSRIKRGERLKDYDWPTITAAVDRLRQINFQVNDRSGLNINQVRASARGLRRRHGKLAGLIVDYLGLMAGTDPKMPRVYQIEEITKGLKSLAKELACPVFLLCQLNRKVEERVDQMPVLSDLRDSGSVEQDADIVMFVHRPYKANPTLADEWKYYAKLSVAKLRDGEPGLIDLMYVGENTRFANWPAETPIPTNQVRVARTSKGAEL
jgi:replicative DNA helicase